MIAADIIVLAGGDVPMGVAALQGLDPSGAKIIAADSGVHLADALGLPVDIAVGDFDSIDPARLASLQGSGSTDLRRHPSDKDAIDLALALDVALEVAAAGGADRVLVAGVEGNRADFVLANQLLVCADRYARLDRQLALVGATAQVVTDHLRLDRPPGSIVSLVPTHGPAVVTFAGVRWPLHEATLEPGTTWALSNESVADIELTVHSGTVLFFELAGPM